MSIQLGDRVRRTGILNHVDRVPEGTEGVVIETRPEDWVRWPYKVNWELSEYNRSVWVDGKDIEKVTQDTLSSFNDAFGEYYVTAKSQQTVPGFSPLVTREDAKRNNHEFDRLEKYTETDMVNHPPHYTRGGIEVLDFIMAYFADDYLLGQVVKYTARSGHKWDTLEDLEKAAFYLNRKIEEVKKGNTND